MFSNRIVLVGFDAIDHGKSDSDERVSSSLFTISLRGRDLRGAVCSVRYYARQI
jgi:hypothetical protein